MTVLGGGVFIQGELVEQSREELQMATEGLAAANGSLRSSKTCFIHWSVIAGA